MDQDAHNSSVERLKWQFAGVVLCHHFKNTSLIIGLDDPELLSFQFPELKAVMANNVHCWGQRRSKAILVQEKLYSDIAHRRDQKLEQNGVDIDKFFIHPQSIQSCTRLGRIERERAPLEMLLQKLLPCRDTGDVIVQWWVMGSTLKPVLVSKGGSNHKPEWHIVVCALKGQTPHRGRYSFAVAVIFFPSFQNASNNLFCVSTAYVSSALLLSE